LCPRVFVRTRNVLRAIYLLFFHFNSFYLKKKLFWMIRRSAWDIKPYVYARKKNIYRPAHSPLNFLWSLLMSFLLFACKCYGDLSSWLDFEWNNEFAIAGGVGRMNEFDISSEGNHGGRSYNFDCTRWAWQIFHQPSAELRILPVNNRLLYCSSILLHLGIIELGTLCLMDYLMTYDWQWLPIVLQNAALRNCLW
jgi:hypothetical protein